jgi:hypothetical protein
MGRLETSWAFAVLIGAPVFGLVISLFNVSTMFAGLVFISTLSTWSVWKIFGQPHSANAANSASLANSGLASSSPASEDESSDPIGANHYSANIAPSGSPEAKALVRRIAAALVCSAAMSFGSICIFSVYGSWLTERFGLSIRAVGLFSVFVGLAELGASTLSSAKTDQWGKRRSVAMGSLVMLAGMVGIGIRLRFVTLRYFRSRRTSQGHGAFHRSRPVPAGTCWSRRASHQSLRRSRHCSDRRNCWSGLTPRLCRHSAGHQELNPSPPHGMFRPELPRG